MRYRAQLGGQPSRDVLLLRLMDAPGRPVVRLRLPGEVEGLSDRWHLCEEGYVDTDDELGPELTGTVVLPDGDVLP